uniref:C-type lectin domain-containing protein n=1 Tax=Acrobeloides nanus TaxID=290746 RepID=A0A914DGL4_9BILA
MRGVYNRTQAQEYCNTFGGSLVSIHSQAENDFIKAFLESKIAGHALIGLIKVQDESANQTEWKWLDGTKTDYTKWNPTEPNNVHNIEDSTEFLTSMGGWNDVPIDMSRIAICQTSCNAERFHVE